MQNFSFPCLTCGNNIYVPADQIRIHIDLDEKKKKIIDSHITFYCPICFTKLKGLTGKNIELLKTLRGSGAKYSIQGDIKKFIDSIFRKISRKDSLKKKEPPPLTHDDLLDMHLLLKEIETVDDIQKIIDKRKNKKDP